MRLMQSNGIRKEAWEKISNGIYKRTFNEQDVKMYNYFKDKVAFKGIKNGDTLFLAKASASNQKEQHNEQEFEGIEGGKGNDFHMQAVDDEVGGFSSDDEVAIPNSHNVSMAQLRNLDAKRIQVLCCE
ncbi:unnamed protein product [Strongylus vulgaris]|uniref:Uncharacterized protein n=1 Tax=Strongylus vulgaris TaxID=40348 RepID=A0A3P7ISK2_STRVU|nr:unnamed protein product [Strongylus vulgaris]